MAAPTITKQPRSQKGSVGQTLTFDVTATGETLTYQWQKDGRAVSGGTSATCNFNLTEEDNGAEITVKVKNSDGEVTSDPALIAVSGGPLLYDPDFASGTFKKLAALFLFILIPMIWVALRTIAPPDDNFPVVSGAIAIQLVIVGVAVAFAAIYMTLLEFRGRARTAGELSPPETVKEAKESLLSEVIQKVPETLRALGELKAPAALIALAAVLFISAASIAWRAVPSTDTTPSPSPSPTATPTP